MKKSLLILGVALSVAASAQNRRVYSTPHKVTAPNKNVSFPEVYSNAPLPNAKNNGAARHGNGSNHTTSISQVMIGSSGNCLGPAFGPKTNLWYDKDINTVAFTHRSATPTLGLYYFDASTNGGTSFTINNNSGGDSADVKRGRYPHGVIYNPAGNTDPNNSFIATLGPSTDGTGTGFCTSFWTGVITGNAPINGTSHNWQWHSCAADGLNTLIPSAGQIVKNTGVAYFVVNGYDGSDYNDTIVLIKGVWNSGTSSMDYTFNKIYLPMCIGSTGTKAFVDVNTAWSDDGQIGYITVLGNDWVCNVEPDDTTFGLIVLKTTDGGNNWTKLGRPWLSLLDPVLLNGGFFCTTAFEHDAVLDKNNDLHVVVGVGPYAGGGSISTGAGSWGIFDIMYKQSEDSWKATLLAKPGTFRGNYGDANNATLHPPIPEDSRPQASRSWDGSKLFFTWFDTDTNVYGSGVENIFRDMHSIGYDVDNDFWTAEVNHTEFSGTDLDGACNWGNVSYYTINNGTDECIPMVAGTMVAPPTSTEQPLQFYYINGACMSNYVNAIPSTPLFIWMGQNNPTSVGVFNVTSNYPNPYTGKTSVDVTLAKGVDVTIEISNAIGQVLSTKVYKNNHSGINTLSIDGTSLSKGLYYYTVKAGSESVTKTMSVE